MNKWYTIVDSFDAFIYKNEPYFMKTFHASDNQFCRTENEINYISSPVREKFSSHMRDLLVTNRVNSL